MFEDQLQAVHELLKSDETFRQLHEQHRTLKEEIEANARNRDHFELERMKKQKLILKDKMATILDQHTSTNA